MNKTQENENLNAIVDALIEGIKLFNQIVTESIEKIKQNKANEADYYIVSLYYELYKYNFKN